MQNKTIEILAPVGDEDMLRAAVFSGADSIYLGVTDFNARRGATGFSDQSLAQATAFCHAHGCKVYAALNTLSFEGQQQNLAQAVKDVAAAGCDAIITQDLATALAVQKFAPGLPLHASTQMSVHSLAGVRTLAKLGFTRVVLARELTAAEIAEIAAESPIELEVFVHGALCVCISGQCNMSAFLGGRSANRGGCAGPCRLPFRAENAKQKNSTPAVEEHHLSLKDLSILDALPYLQNLGIASAKIEGRLRGADYCAVVVDAACKAREGKPYNKELLQKVFSRSGFTDGWYTGQKGAAMFGTRTAADTAAVKNAIPAARELYRRERPRVALKMQLTATLQDISLTVTDTDNNTVSLHQKEPLQPAQKDGTEALKKVLSKTGGTPFYVLPEDITLDTGGLFLPSPVVSALRKQALEQLIEKRKLPKPYPSTQVLPLLQLLETAKTPVNVAANNSIPAPLRLRARFEHVTQMPDNTAALCEELLFPISEAALVPPHLRSKTQLWLPRVLFSEEERQVQQLVKQAATMGFAGFEANNISHFEICGGLPISAGFGLNIANSDALEIYAALGCSMATLSLELNLSAMRHIAENANFIATDALCYGFLPLMITRAQPFANISAATLPTGQLADRMGKRLLAQYSYGTTSIYNPVPLWMGDRQKDIPTTFATLYFTQESKARAAQILQNFIQQQAAAGDFTRGLYDKPLQGR